MHKASETGQLSALDQEIDQLIVRQVKPTQITDAQHALWYHFLIECKWTVPTDFPTKWEVLQSEGRKIIVDRFDRLGLTRYYGAYKLEGGKEVLKGVVRSIDFQETLDFLQYQVELLDRKYVNKQTREVCRIYVSREYRKSYRLYVRLVQQARKSIGNQAYILATSQLTQLYDYCPQKPVGMVRYPCDKDWSAIYLIGSYEQLQSALDVRKKIPYPLPVPIVYEQQPHCIDIWHKHRQQGGQPKL